LHQDNKFIYKLTHTKHSEFLILLFTFLRGKRAKNKGLLLFQRSHAEIARTGKNKTLKVLWLGSVREHNKKLS
jgi:hypothetical protein